MSILLDENSRVVVQGLSGYQAQFDTKFGLDYGTNILAGVVPGREGQTVLGLPIYNSVRQAVINHGVDTSAIYIPARAAKDAILEAIYAGIKLIVIVSEMIPLKDFAQVYRIAKSHDVRLIGPNCNGIISPGKAKILILGNDYRFFTPGPVGVLSRSGGMNHEVSNLLTLKGIGQSTCVSIGGDVMVGTTFREGLELFEEDDQTKVVLMYCEPGGRMEEDAAQFIQEGRFSKPVVAFVVGEFMEKLPQGMPFGHAGAIIEGGVGKPSVKKKILAAAGVHVAERLNDIPDIIKNLLN